MLSSKRWGQTGFAAIFAFVSMVTVASAQLPFSSPLNISNNTDFTATPQVAVDSTGKIFVVWEDDKARSGNILFSRSTDGGATFAAPITLSNSTTFPFSPQIAVDSNGAINVVWNDTATNNLDIFFARSTDGGLTFSAPANVSHDSNTSSNPLVATDSLGNIFVAWESDSSALGIFLSRSTDGGVTFSPATMVSSNATGSSFPHLAVAPNGNIYLVWQDSTPSNFEISFARSTDHGLTFSAPLGLSGGSCHCTVPQFQTDAAGNINVVWENDATGSITVYFSRSTDNGQTFSAPLKVTNGPDFSSAPMIASDATGAINLLWLDAAPPTLANDIFFARSANGGASFSVPINLSNNTTFSSNPAFAIDPAGNINVVWQDAVSGSNDVFFTRSTDKGATFSAAQNLSNNSGESSASQIVSDNRGNLNVVWSDSTPGANQIFFSRFTNPVVNHPPVADAGPDQNIQATTHGTTPVQLNGSNSSDPDKDTLSFVWTDQSNNIVGTTATVQLNLLPGSYTFTLTVTDPGNLNNSAVTHVNIALPLNRAPVAVAGANQTLGCTSINGASVVLNGSGSSDPDGDTLSFVWRDSSNNIVATTANAQITAPFGTHSYTLTVTDPDGLSSSASTQITVRDTASPRLSVALSPNVLQPANHQLVPVTATVTAGDACSSSVSVKLVSIVSSEPDSGIDPNDVPNDIQSASGGPIVFGNDVRSFQLRAENLGNGANRTYTVTYSATDTAGNTTNASAVVTVSGQCNHGHHHHRRRRHHHHHN